MHSRINELPSTQRTEYLAEPPDAARVSSHQGTARRLLGEIRPSAGSELTPSALCLPRIKKTATAATATKPPIEFEEEVGCQMSARLCLSPAVQDSLSPSQRGCAVSLPRHCREYLHFSSPGHMMPACILISSRLRFLIGSHWFIY